MNDTESPTIIGNIEVRQSESGLWRHYDARTGKRVPGREQAWLRRDQAVTAARRIEAREARKEAGARR